MDSKTLALVALTLTVLTSVGTWALLRTDASAEGYENSSGGRSLVVIHAEWCGHCRELLKENGVWERLKKELPGVVVREINERDDVDIVSSLGVVSFPDIRILDGDQHVAHFEGPRTVEALKEFVLRHTDTPPQKEL